MSQILTVSPKGQITLPATTRRELPYKKFQLTQVGQALILKPVEIKVIQDDELNEFHKLSETSFSFWNNQEDDVYGEFYKI